MRVPALSQFHWGIVLATAVMVGVSAKGIAQTREFEPSSSEGENPPAEEILPTLSLESITLGQPCGQPYVVAVPYGTVDLLSRVQATVPSAFITDSRFGPYVQAGSSSRRAPAERINHQLRRAGFDARVIYRPIACESSQSP